ncbi:hypothetical protein BDW02DRAFT_572140 [Decorospora gaudefroyi]|uniref:Uncharacterized protein n=1 Tax=Decorospora gaudefroyi TaxID=184978 RepID=A0A6A5KD41_9PLEO|nr:hypothetical protein BDW02DRAFT_572140 [Decorospora gaudefroyi]
MSWWGRVRGTSGFVVGGVWSSYQEGDFGQRTRLVLASITPAYPWMFHGPEQARLFTVTGEQRPSPPERPIY